MKNTAIDKLKDAMQYMSEKCVCENIFPIIIDESKSSTIAYKCCTMAALCSMSKHTNETFTLNKIMPVVVDFMKEDEEKIKIAVMEKFSILAKQINT